MIAHCILLGMLSVVFTWCSTIPEHSQFFTVLMLNEPLKIPKELVSLFNLLPASNQYPINSNERIFYCHYPSNFLISMLQILETAEGFKCICRMCQKKNQQFPTAFLYRFVRPWTLTGIKLFWDLNSKIDCGKITQYPYLCVLIAKFQKNNILFPIFEKEKLEMPYIHEAPYKTGHTLDVVHSKYEVLALSFDQFIPVVNNFAFYNLWSYQSCQEYKYLFPIGISYDYKFVFHFNYFANPMNLVKFLCQNSASVKVTFKVNWIYELMRRFHEMGYLVRNFGLNDLAFNYLVRKEKTEEKSGSDLDEWSQDMATFIRGNSVLAEILGDSGSATLESSFVDSDANKKATSNFNGSNGEIYHLFIQVSLRHLPATFRCFYKSNEKVEDKKDLEQAINTMRQFFSTLEFPVEFEESPGMEKLNTLNEGNAT